MDGSGHMSLGQGARHRPYYDVGERIKPNTSQKFFFLFFPFLSSTLPPTFITVVRMTLFIQPSHGWFQINFLFLSTIGVLTVLLARPSNISHIITQNIARRSKRLVITRKSVLLENCARTQPDSARLIKPSEYGASATSGTQSCRASLCYRRGWTFTIVDSDSGIRYDSVPSGWSAGPRERALQALAVCQKLAVRIFSTQRGLFRGRSYDRPSGNL
ncbi:hypothetical protein F4806DRAFT_201643 [Annulohypoxylon nitens]|nr:hypothetical protein F4806DRAFT_201643 [Annulohypoxylon nitens]